jgi:hypothetical protein
MLNPNFENYWKNVILMRRCMLNPNFENYWKNVILMRRFIFKNCTNIFTKNEFVK